MKNYIIIAVLGLAILGIASKAMYVAPVISGCIWAEEAQVGTTTGYLLSFGNGDGDSDITIPFDIWVTHMSLSAQTNCSGGETITLDVDDSNLLGITVSISSGGHSATTTISPPEKIVAGSKIKFDRTVGCSSGGDGTIATLWYVARASNIPDELKY